MKTDLHRTQPSLESTNSPEVIAADSVPDSPNIIPRTPPGAGGRVPVRTAFRRDLLPWFSQSAKRGYDEEESGEDLVNQLPRWTTEIILYYKLTSLK